MTVDFKSFRHFTYPWQIFNNFEKIFFDINFSLIIICFVFMGPTYKRYRPGRTAAGVLGSERTSMFSDYLLMRVCFLFQLNCYCISESRFIWLVIWLFIICLFFVVAPDPVSDKVLFRSFLVLVGMSVSRIGVAFQLLFNFVSVMQQIYNKLIGSGCK